MTSRSPWRKRRLLSDPSAWLPAILLAALYAHLVWFVLHNVVDTPFMDEWLVWSALLKAIDDRSLSWDFLVSSYNGHRLATVRLALLALSPTRLSVYPQVLLTLLVTAVFMGVIWHQFRSTAARVGGHVDPWAAVALGALVFSSADINRLWGMGLAWHTMTLGSTACLMLLSATPFRWWRLFAAGLCASLASLSIASGLLVWFLGIPVLWIATARSGTRARALIVWSAAAAAFCTLYLRDLPELGGHSGPAFTPGRVFWAARFVLTYVGLPIQLRYDPSLFLVLGIAGIAVLVAACALLWKYRRPIVIPLLPWLAVAAFSVAAGTMIATARPDAPHVALYYITVARLFWIASLGALCVILLRRADGSSEPWTGWRRWRIPLIAVFLLCLEMQQARTMAELWQPLREDLMQAGYDAPDICAGNWDAVSRVTEPRDLMRSQYPILANHGTSFTQVPTLGEIELRGARTAGEVNSALVEASPPDNGPSCVQLSGWAMDPGSEEAAREVLLVQNNQVIKRGAVNQATPQIAARFNNPRLNRSGWAIFVSEPRWPRDSSSFAIYGLSRDGSAAYRLDLAPGVELPGGDLDSFQEYPLGRTMNFAETRDVVPYQLRGFSVPEAGGRWTDANEAVISVKLARPITSALALVATADAFLLPQLATQRADIFVNDQPVGRWEFRLGDTMREREIRIPEGTVAGAKHLVITFRLPDAATPAGMHFNSDTRLLGMRVARFRIVEAK